MYVHRVTLTCLIFNRIIFRFDGFQQQRPQRLIDEYEHMNSQNDSLMMRLKAIEAEYYSIEN